MIASPNHRWYIVCVTVANQAFVLGLLIYSFALFVPFWLKEFSISRSSVMIAITASSLVTGALSPIAGRMFDRYSPRSLVLVGLICASASLFFLSQATAFWQIILIYSTLLPMGFALCGPLPSQIIVSKWFKGKRGLAIGITAMGPNMGGLIIPLSLSLLMLQYDWHHIFLIAAIVYLLMLLPLNLFILRFEPPEAANNADATSADQREWKSSEVLRSAAFWIPLIGLVPIAIMYNGVQFHLGALVLDYGLEAALAGKLIAISAATMIAGILLFGSLADKIDHRKIYWLIAISAIISMMILLNWPLEAGLIIACALNGFAMGGVPTTLSMMCSIRFGTRSFGKVLGMAHLFLMSAMLGSIFSGWIFDTQQSYDIAFIVFAVMILPGIILMRFLPTRAAIAAESHNI